MGLELLTGIPIWIYAILAIIGFLQLALRIRIIPSKRAVQFLLVFGVIGLLAHGGVFEGLFPTGKAVAEEGMFTYAIAPSATAPTELKDSTLRLDVEYNETSETLNNNIIDGTFGVSRLDVSTEDSVFKIKTEQVSITDDSGNEYKLFDELDNGKLKVEIIKDQSTAYEERSVLIEGGGEVSVEIKAHINDLVGKGMEQYDTVTAPLTIDGETYNLEILLTGKVA